MKPFPPDLIRSALRELKGKTAEIGADAPSWERVLTVREHEGALDPYRPVVIGDRGTGKSFWTGALLDETSRDRLSAIYNRLQLSTFSVSLGFGGDSFSSSHPTSNELSDLLAKNLSAEAIWRAVILFSSPFAETASVPKLVSWEDRTRWIVDDPALRRDVFVSLDRGLIGEQKKYMIVFDALDTLATTWSEIAVLMRGLLQVCLFLRSSKNIRVKLFIRPDMVDDATLWAIGDSSKLRHNEVTLVWTRRDLHALLIQYLANHELTSNLVSQYTELRLHSGLVEEGGRLKAPDTLMSSDSEQQQFFSLLAGDYMGRSATKGRTYTWVPNHLANARGYAAPRSFLLALGVAAEKSRGMITALDVQGIQDGVRQASQSRMLELKEDYRWIDAVFRPLRDMQVPVYRRDIIARWREGKVISAITSEMGADTSGRYLPPPRLESMTDDSSTLVALIETLDHLGIVETTGDGRINMPDLFRLAAGVKRMGGVKLRP